MIEPPLPVQEDILPASWPPIGLGIEQPQQLSRWKLFIKWLFCLPLFLWLAIYGILASLVAFIAFWAILFTGRYPLGLFEFVRGYIQAQFRVQAYFPLLITDRWKPSSPHPVTLYARPPEKLSRLILVFIKFPLFVTSAVSSVAGFGMFAAYLMTIPAWFGILFTGRYPNYPFVFIRNVSQWAARLYAWQMLMSDDWRLWGETTVVRVFTAIGAALMATFSAAVLILSISGVDLTKWATSLLGVDAGKAVVEEFMFAGEERDVDYALTLTDPETITRAELVTLFQRRDIFEGWLDIQIDSFNVQTDNRSGTRLFLEGDVLYAAGGNQRRFEAFLIKRDGVWKLRSIQFLR